MGPCRRVRLGHAPVTAVQAPRAPARPSVILIDHQGVVLAAPEVAIATPARSSPGRPCRRRRPGLPRRMRTSTAAGHMPLKPVLGERIIIGRRGTDRAVYRITFTSIAGHIRLEREA